METGTTGVFRTMCPMNCHPTLCGMRVEVDDGHLVSVKGDPDNPDSRGFLCIRGQASREIIDNPRLASEMSRNAAARALGYRWPITAARLRRIYADLAVRQLVECS